MFRMASSFVPVDNTRNGFTIVTHVVPAGGEQYGLGTGGGGSTQGPLKKLLKGEPKALGTVQIMIGIMTFLFGIVKTIHRPLLGVISGVTYWGSFSYITSGSLSVAAAKGGNRCVVTSSLIMNVISAVAAGIAIVLLSFDLNIQLHYRSFYYEGQPAGISGVLLVFMLLEFFISICTSGFACRATCCTEAVATIHVNYPETRNLAENVYSGVIVNQR